MKKLKPTASPPIDAHVQGDRIQPLAAARARAGAESKAGAGEGTVSEGAGSGSGTHAEDWAMAAAGSNGLRLDVEYRGVDGDRRVRDDPTEAKARGWGAGMLRAERVSATASSSSPQDGQVGLMTPGREPKLLPHGTHFHVRRTMGFSQLLRGVRDQTCNARVHAVQTPRQNQP